MQETPRLLFVHAHPDDESITNGATIAHYAARGAEVRVVTCTLGEEGEVIGDRWAQLGVDHADQLGGYRIGELTAALRALGVNAPIFLGGPGRWRDSGMAGTEPRGRQQRFIDADEREAVGALVAVIRDIASARRGDLRPQRRIRASRPRSGPCRHHGGGRRGGHRRLPGRAMDGAEVLLDGHRQKRIHGRLGGARSRRLAPEWVIPPADGDFGGLGYSDGEIDAVIEDPDALPAKKAALAAHATQLIVGPTGRALALSNNLALPIVGQEHYILAGRRRGRSR